MGGRGEEGGGRGRAEWIVRILHAVKILILEAMPINIIMCVCTATINNY